MTNAEVYNILIRIMNEFTPIFEEVEVSSEIELEHILHMEDHLHTCLIPAVREGRLHI